MSRVTRLSSRRVEGLGVAGFGLRVSRVEALQGSVLWVWGLGLGVGFRESGGGSWEM